MRDPRQTISPGRKKQTAEFQGVQRAIQKLAIWPMGDVATLSVQIESGDLLDVHACLHSMAPPSVQNGPAAPSATSQALVGRP